METLIREKEILNIDGYDISLSAILDNIGSVVLIVKVNKNGSTLPVWANRKYTELLGYSIEERDKLGFSNAKLSMFHPEDQDLVLNEIKKVFKKRDEERSFIFRIKTKNNKWIWLYFIAKAITIGNNPNYMLCTGYDLMSRSQKRFRKFIQDTNKSKNQDSLCRLTKIEKEIIKEIINGLSIKEIAQKRKRSFETINNQKRNIYKKLCVNKISDLVIFALENGIF